MASNKGRECDEMLMKPKLTERGYDGIKQVTSSKHWNDFSVNQFPTGACLALL